MNRPARHAPGFWDRVNALIFRNGAVLLVWILADVLYTQHWGSSLMSGLRHMPPNTALVWMVFMAIVLLAAQIVVLILWDRENRPEEDAPEEDAPEEDTPEEDTPEED